MSRAVLIARWSFFPLFNDPVRQLAAWAARIRQASGPVRQTFSTRVVAWNLFQRLPRGGHTRSLSEHGSQAPHRRWYLAHGPGRVGRRWILEAPRLTAGGLLVFTDRSALMQAGNRGRASLSPSRPVSTGRSWLTSLRQKRRGAPFFIYRPASFRSRLEVAKGRRLGRLTPAA